MHIEERSSSVWRVRGQVPPKHTFVCSFCRPHSLVFLVRLRHCNKSKQIPCIISRPAVTDSKRRRVIFTSVPPSCCLNIHMNIYIYIYSIIVAKFHSVERFGTRVMITNSFKIMFLLHKRYYRIVYLYCFKRFRYQLLSMIIEHQRFFC